jgi:quercetin dioxygenase-like cupin family protein
MRKFDIKKKPGVICGKENNKGLFIRKMIFPAGYVEARCHHHPNSFEFYLILRGKLKFSTKRKSLTASEGSLVYFKKAEPHRVVEVIEETEVVLFKKLGAIKSE